MIKKFTLLLLAMLCIAGTSKADPTTTQLWPASGTGSQDITWTKFDIPGAGASAFTSVTTGYQITVTVTYSSGDYPKFVLMSGDTEITVYWDWDGVGTASFYITSKMLAKLQASGLSIKGQNLTLTKVELTSGSEIANNVIWKGSKSLGDSWGSISIPQNEVADVAAGGTINVTVESSTDGGLSLQSNGNSVSEDCVWDGTTAKFPITSAVASALTTYGLSVGGKKYTITEVSYVTGSSVEPNVVWFGSKEMSAWGSVKVAANEFESVTEGNILVLTFSGDISSSDFNLVNGSWAIIYSTHEYDEIAKGWQGTVDDGYGIEKTSTQIRIPLSPKMVTLCKASGFIFRPEAAATLTKIELCSYKSGDNVYISVGGIGYATFCFGDKLDFTGLGVEAYYGSSVSDDKLYLAQVTKAPASTGLILKGTASTVYKVPVTTADADDVTGNMLVGITSATEVTASNNYIFAKKGDVYGFYPLNASHTLAGYKAYLNYTSPTQAPALKLIFGGEGEGTTGINTVSKNPVVEDGVYYNLQGVAVKNPSKGLYILNGKKVIVK